MGARERNVVIKRECVPTRRSRAAHLAQMRATLVSTGKSFLYRLSSMMQAVDLRPRPPASLLLLSSLA